MVSDEYLSKLRRSIRRNPSDEVDAELRDLIDECRADLVSLGVSKEKVENEEDPLVLGTIRCLVRWKFGLSNEDAAGNREDYLVLRDELRRRVEYGVEDANVFQ